MRQKFEIAKDELQELVTAVETSNRPSNRSQLWEQVSAAFAATSGVTIAPGTISARARRDNIEITTVSAVATGRPMTAERLAKMQAGRTGKKRVSARDKIQSIPGLDRQIEELRKRTPPQYEKLAERVIKGSLRAATKLMCLWCVNYSRSEVAECTGNHCGCPLWLTRPYQTGEPLDDADDNDNDND